MSRVLVSQAVPRSALELVQSAGLDVDARRESEPLPRAHLGRRIAGCDGLVCLLTDVIAVTNTPDVLTESTADLTLALGLALARRLLEADAYARSGAWTRWELEPELMGTDVHGATLGIIVMGRIGQAVARRAAHGFGMRVLYSNHARLPGTAERGATAVDLAALLAASDVVSLHAPATSALRHLIGPSSWP